MPAVGWREEKSMMGQMEVTGCRSEGRSPATCVGVATAQQHHVGELAWACHFRTGKSGLSQDMSQFEMLGNDSKV